MELLEQYEAACKVRRLAPRTIQTYRRWVEEFLRFHHDRTGGGKAQKKQAVVALTRRRLVRCGAMLRDGAPWRERGPPAAAPA